MISKNLLGKVQKYGQSWKSSSASYYSDVKSIGIEFQGANYFLPEKLTSELVSSTKQNLHEILKPTNRNNKIVRMQFFSFSFCFEIFLRNNPRFVIKHLLQRAYDLS